MNPIGYFVWSRTDRGTFDCSKISREILEGMQPPTKKTFDAKAATRFPLTEAEWTSSLKELAAKYPAPERK